MGSRVKILNANISDLIRKRKIQRNRSKEWLSQKNLNAPIEAVIQKKKPFHYEFSCDNMYMLLVKEQGKGKGISRQLL